MVCLLSCSAAALVLVVQHGGWCGTPCLVVELLCSGTRMLLDWIAMLGCGVFLV